MTKRVRTLFITYEASEDDAETFMVVVGSIADNFKGVEVVDYQDDTLFSEADPDPKELLHSLITADDRLTAEQKRELEAFTQRLNEWSGEED